MPEVPTWKDHFPISWVDDHFVTRREFTKSLVWVSLATFLANQRVTGPKYVGNYDKQIAFFSHATGAIRDSGSSGEYPRASSANTEFIIAG